MKLHYTQIENYISLLEEHHRLNAKGSFSERKVRKLILDHLDDPKVLMLTNKDVTALLIFQVVPSHFTTQQNLQEVAFYSRTPGSGFRLLKEAKVWVDKWGDGLLYKTFLSTGTEETNKMLERIGMKQIGVMLDMGDV